MSKLITLLFLSTSLISCTSEKSRVEKEALEIAQSQFTEELKKEASDQGLASWLQETYVDYLKSKTEFDAEVEVTDTKATAAVRMTTYPAKFRATLLGVAQKVPPGKSNAFSYAQAAPMVAAQTGEKQIPFETAHYLRLQFKKTGDAWVLQSQ